MGKASKSGGASADEYGEVSYPITRLLAIRQSSIYPMKTLQFCVEYSTKQVSWILFEMLGSDLKEATDMACGLIHSAADGFKTYHPTVFPDVPILTQFICMTGYGKTSGDFSPLSWWASNDMTGCISYNEPKEYLEDIPYFDIYKDNIYYQISAMEVGWIEAHSGDYSLPLPTKAQQKMAEAYIKEHARDAPIKLLHIDQILSGESDEITKKRGRPAGPASNLAKLVKMTRVDVGAAAGGGESGQEKMFDLVVKSIKGTLNDRGRKPALLPSALEYIKNNLTTPALKAKFLKDQEEYWAKKLSSRTQPGGAGGAEEAEAEAAEKPTSQDGDEEDGTQFRMVPADEPPPKPTPTSPKPTPKSAAPKPTLTSPKPTAKPTPAKPSPKPTLTTTKTPKTGKEAEQEPKSTGGGRGLGKGVFQKK